MEGGESRGQVVEGLGVKGLVRKGGGNKEGLERGRTGRGRVRWEEEQKRGGTVRKRVKR